MRSNLTRRLAVVGLAPALFWVLATGVEIVRRDPDALETPVVYLALTWSLYFPVFGLAGAMLLRGVRLVRFGTVSLLLWFGAIGGAALAVLCLGIASMTYRLPMRVWPLCVVVGAVMGVSLVRGECHEPRGR